MARIQHVHPIIDPEELVPDTGKEHVYQWVEFRAGDPGIRALHTEDCPACWSGRDMEFFLYRLEFCEN